MYIQHASSDMPWLAISSAPVCDKSKSSQITIRLSLSTSPRGHTCFYDLSVRHGNHRLLEAVQYRYTESRLYLNMHTSSLSVSTAIRLWWFSTGRLRERDTSYPIHVLCPCLSREHGEDASPTPNIQHYFVLEDVLVVVHGVPVGECPHFVLQHLLV